MENKVICNCKHVTLNDIEKVMHESVHFAEVEKAFDKVQMSTHCSTGCGGCHDKVMDVISDIMHGEL